MGSREELIIRNYTNNLDGDTLITEDCKDVIHIFTNLKKRSPLYLYNLIPLEKELNYDLRRINTFDQPIHIMYMYSKTFSKTVQKNGTYQYNIVKRFLT